MIPAHGYQVVFTRERDGRTYWDPRPVLAWDDSGNPLITDRTGLTTPDDYSRADWELVDLDEHTILPGGGWLVTFTDDEGHTWTEPIVAWRIDTHGYGRPITVDSEGLTEPLDADRTDRTVWHPDALDGDEKTWRTHHPTTRDATP